MIKKTNLMYILLLLLLIFYACPNNTTDKNDISFTNDEKALKEYLQENRTALNVEDNENYEDLNILLPDLQDKSIFFTAEFHGNKANVLLRIKFLKFLKKHTNFKYYLEEIPYSAAYYINNYLESGDISILEKVFEPMQGTFFWNKDQFNHWIDIYEINKTLNSQDKIKVIGVDIEHQPYTAYRYMTDILPTSEVPDEIKESINLLKSKFKNLNPLSYQYEECKSLSLNIKNNIEDNLQIYKEYLGEGFLGFNLVNNNILYLLEAKSNRQNSFTGWNNTRDKYIYENFKIIDTTLPKGKYYGQWGMNHAFQREHDGVIWFATYLNRPDSKYHTKVFTTIYNYDNCTQMNRNNGSYINTPLQAVLPVLSDLTPDFNEDFNLIKLNDTTSRPNFKMVSFNDQKPINFDVSEYFQYIVVIKNAGATEPLGN